MSPLSFHLNITLPVCLGLLTWLPSLLRLPVLVIPVKRLYARGAMGLALPGLICIVEDSYDERAGLRHELAHQVQFRKWSPIGVALILGWFYGKGYLHGRIRDGRWPVFHQLWASNPLEIDANRAMIDSRPLPRFIKFRSANSSLR